MARCRHKCVWASGLAVPETGSRLRIQATFPDTWPLPTGGRGSRKVHVDSWEPRPVQTLTRPVTPAPFPFYSSGSEPPPRRGEGWRGPVEPVSTVRGFELSSVETRAFSWLVLSLLAVPGDWAKMLRSKADLSELQFVHSLTGVCSHVHTCAHTHAHTSPRWECPPPRCVSGHLL